MFGIPLEYLMFGGIGFCLAALIALMVMPAVHRRADRLARARYDDLPLSMQEIRAEKDTIRAGFAAATRDLELRVDKLREKTAAHATELARKNALLERLRQEAEAAVTALRESEAREQALRDELREARRGFAARDVTLDEAEREIASLRRDLKQKDAALCAAQADLESAQRALAGKTDALAVAERNLAERDAALQELERAVAALRAERAGRDAALTRAEHDIAAIKAEIAAFAAGRPLQRPALQRADTQPLADRPVEVVPFVPAPRPATTAPTTREAEPLQRDTAAPRAPLDVIPAPSRLLPPTIPPAQRPSDNVRQAAAEIADAARRIDDNHDGQNQRLRALYAPTIKPTP
ncbi:hypothetical protein [Pseudorhodoplanes sp.]|uniref:hypothetical protein n=1 Tax=Pseudorhodoplanes sp. TaxID=1934341 RepID=UPI0039196C50